jgi:hypothetical protein
MVDAALIDTDMVVRSIEIHRREVVYVKSIVQASEGLCCLLADRSKGPILLVAPRDREAELDRLVDDLVNELGESTMIVHRDHRPDDNVVLSKSRSKETRTCQRRVARGETML